MTMRSSLAPLRGKRSRFSAIFAGVSSQGHIILEDVRAATGTVPYSWVEFQEWKSQLLMPGSEVSFQATVRTYYSDHRDEFDYGLSEISEVRA